MEGKILVLFLCLTLAIASEREVKRQLSFFNVVTFPNDVCIGEGSKNGTCYTTEECDERGGVTSGTCAQGYGVCCIVSLSCGQTSAENCTYLEMARTSKPSISNCEYTICPVNNNICRLRLDFETFTIAGPATTTGAASAKEYGTALGDCVTDTLVVTGPSGSATPIICGENKGQHLYVDIAPECARVSFRFGTSTSTSRQYTIKTMQYTCNDEMGGPRGCMQYFAGTSGTVSSFNFPATTTTIATDSDITHLSNQHYDICFRRADGKCRLCFSPSLTGSFGLSVSPNAAAKAAANTNCGTDYLHIPQFNTPPTAVTSASSAATGNERVCGRFFAIEDGTAGVTLCTSRRPFSITFRTDEDEATNSISTTIASATEAAGNPKGYLGFSLKFFQESC